MGLNLTAPSDYLAYRGHPSARIGGSTVLAVMRRATSGGAAAVAVNLVTAGNVNVMAFGFRTTTDLPYLQSDLGIVSSPVSMTGTTADGWFCLGLTKATGSSTPRFHKHVYSTGITTHEDATVAQGDGSVLGASGNLVLGRGSPILTTTAPGDYAVVAIFDRVLSDEEVESASQSLSAMKALGPSWGLWEFNADGAAGAEEFFIRSFYTGGTSTGVSTTDPAFGYGFEALATILAAPPSSAGTFASTADGLSTFSGSGALAPHPIPAGAIPSDREGVGWRFVALKPSGLRVPIYPAITGSLTHDWQRDVRRAVSGVTLLPEDVRKLNLVGDRVLLTLRVDGVEKPMGIFNFTDDIDQRAVIIDPETGETADLKTVGLSDQMIRLRRSTGAPQTLLSGTDPSQEMRRILDAIGLPNSVAGPISPMKGTVVWDGGTTDYQKVSELADLAGHRPPWADNFGVIRSVASGVVQTDIIDLTDLGVEAGSISIQNNYLSAPNRVIVTDNGDSPYPIRGQWDAPASAPHSETNRGYLLTETVTMQGLAGQEHANAVAATMGEQFTARELSCNLIKPTDRLDGPVVIRFDGILWIVTGWSISLEANQRMSIKATELTD